jgi:lipoprotein-releasing system permease protein
MRFALFIARRYLSARRDQAFISVISWISVAGVALGVASLIVVMSVMNGFTTDLRDKIVGVTSHAVLYGTEGAMREDASLARAVAGIDGVTGVTPFIYAELMLSTQNGVKGVILRGIDPQSAPQVLGALDKLTSGSVADLAADGALPGIIVGQSLARKLGLFIGSRVNMLAPSGQSGAAGFSPRIMPFRVAGIFAIGLIEYDSSMAFVSLDAARNVMGWPDGAVTGMEIAVADIYRAQQVLNRVLDALGPQKYHGQSWMSMNANLFAALKLEKAAMAVILTLVVLVGSFSIITALVMLVMEKTRDIAVMMSMGATRPSIRRIFITQGIIIGLVGTALGNILGLAACFLLKRYKFIELPSGVYSLDYLPVLLEFSDILLASAGALGLCFLATLYPAHQASKLEPVAALRQE